MSLIGIILLAILFVPFFSLSIFWIYQYIYMRGYFVGFHDYAAYIQKNYVISEIKTLPKEEALS